MSYEITCERTTNFKKKIFELNNFSKFLQQLIQMNHWLITRNIFLFQLKMTDLKRPNYFIIRLWQLMKSYRLHSIFLSQIGHICIRNDILWNQLECTVIYCILHGLNCDRNLHLSPGLGLGLGLGFDFVKSLLIRRSICEQSMILTSCNIDTYLSAIAPLTMVVAVVANDNWNKNAAKIGPMRGSPAVNQNPFIFV